MCVHFIMHSQWRERGPFSSLGYGAGSLQLDILKKKKKLFAETLRFNPFPCGF